MEYQEYLSEKTSQRREANQTLLRLKQLTRVGHYTDTMRPSDTIYYVDFANIAHSGLLLVVNNNYCYYYYCKSKNESQLVGNYCFTFQVLWEQNKTISPSWFSFRVFAEHIDMADSLVGRPQLNLRKISIDQLRTLLSYNPVLFFPDHWVKISQRCCWAIITISSFMIRGRYWSLFSTYKVILCYWKWYFWPVREKLS